jgi:hydrogenase nickel incorporation protein HypA/HybF
MTADAYILLGKVLRMHELSVTKNVLQLVIKHAEINKARKVVGVQLEIGEMRDIIGDLMQKCFQYLARGTIAEGAELKIEVIPLTCICRSCNEIFSVNAHKGFNDLSCPKCKGTSLVPYSGQEFIIKAIDIL